MIRKAIIAFAGIILSLSLVERLQARTGSSGGEDLGVALRRHAASTGGQILFDPALVKGKRAHPVRGNGEPLAQMLAGSGLRARIVGNGLILIERDSASLALARPFGPKEGPVPGQQDMPGQDIIVTALKRRSLIGNTPGMIAAVQGEKIAALGITGLHDISQNMPGLAVLGTRTGEQRIALRGINGTGEATVGVYYGETPVSGPSGTTFDSGAVTPDIDLADVGRVELLYGPQGTLYGASSMGGTLRVIFRQPDLETMSVTVSTGISSVSGGHGMTANLSAVLNAPLTKDKLAVRGVVYHRQEPSFIDKPALGIRNIGGAQRRGGRLSLRAEPDDAIRFSVTGIYHQLSVDDSETWHMDMGPYVNAQSVRTPYDSKLRLANMTAEFDIDGKLLLLTASRYRWNLLRQGDFTSVIVGGRNSLAACNRLFGLAGGYGMDCDAEQMGQFATFVDSRVPALLYQPMSVSNTSGEARLSYDMDAPLQWTVGAFFENRNDSTNSYTVRADQATGEILFPLDITGLRTIDVSLKQLALFGEARYEFHPNWTAILGGRKFHYRRAAHGAVPVPNIITGTAYLEAGNQKTTEDGSSLKFELAWRPAPDRLLYAQVAQGFRPGGVNITPGLSEAERSYAPDRLWSHTLGFKMKVSDVGSLDIAIFRIDWNNMIYSVTSDNGAFTYNANVGKVRVYGVEMAADYRLASSLSINGRVNYTDARLVGQGLVSSGGRDGDRLPDVSPFGMIVGLVWTRPLGEGRSIVTNLNLHGRAPVGNRFNPASEYYVRVPAYILTDVTTEFVSGGWRVGLGIRNLLNHRTITRISSGAYIQRTVYGSRPRTLSLRLSHNF